MAAIWADLRTRLWQRRSVPVRPCSRWPTRSTRRGLALRHLHGIHLPEHGQGSMPISSWRGRPCRNGSPPRAPNAISWPTTSRTAPCPDHPDAIIIHQLGRFHAGLCRGRRHPRPVAGQAEPGPRLRGGRRHAGRDGSGRATSPWASDFPVFLHPRTKEEYALARTERKTRGRLQAASRSTAAPDVTLEDDLARRDLTINAMAQAADDADGQLGRTRRSTRTAASAT